MGINAFTPSGNTVVLTAATSYPTAIQATSSSGSIMQYRIINSSTTQGCFLSYAQTQALAQTNCVIPTAGAGNSTTTLYVLPNTDEILTFNPGAWFTAITAANSATLYIVPGDGM